MKNKLIFFLIFGITILLTGCFSQPVVANNHTDNWICKGKENRVLIDIVKNTPHNKKVLTEELRKELNKTFTKISSKRKNNKRINFNTAYDICQKAYKLSSCTSVSSCKTIQRLVDRCANNKAGTYSTFYTGLNRTTYEDTDKLGESYLFGYVIIEEDNKYRKNSIRILENGDNIVIYKTGNICTDSPGIVAVIKKVMKENNVKSLKLKYYKL